MEIWSPSILIEISVRAAVICLSYPATARTKLCGIQNRNILLPIVRKILTGNYRRRGLRGLNQRQKAPGGGCSFCAPERPSTALSLISSSLSAIIANRERESLSGVAWRADLKCKRTKDFPAKAGTQLGFVFALALCSAIMCEVPRFPKTEPFEPDLKILEAEVREIYQKEEPATLMDS